MCPSAAEQVFWASIAHFYFSPSQLPVPINLRANLTTLFFYAPVRHATLSTTTALIFSPSPATLIFFFSPHPLVPWPGFVFLFSCFLVFWLWFIVVEPRLSPPHTFSTKTLSTFSEHPHPSPISRTSSQSLHFRTSLPARYAASSHQFHISPPAL